MTKFETQPCPRCNGLGHYSRNAYGSTTCYQCRGAKVVLTKRGKAAQRHFHAAMETRIDAVPEGHLIWWDFGLGKANWRTLASAKRIPPNVIPAPPEGYQILVTSQHGAQVILSPSHVVRSVESMAERDRLVAEALQYQATLGANGKTTTKEAA